MYFTYSSCTLFQCPCFQLQPSPPPPIYLRIALLCSTLEFYISLLLTICDTLCRCEVWLSILSFCAFDLSSHLVLLNVQNDFKLLLHIYLYGMYCLLFFHSLHHSGLCILLIKRNNVQAAVDSSISQLSTYIVHFAAL